MLNIALPTLLVLAAPAAAYWDSNRDDFERDWNRARGLSIGVIVAIVVVNVVFWGGLICVLAYCMRRRRRNHERAMGPPPPLDMNYAQPSAFDDGKYPPPPPSYAAPGTGYEMPYAQPSAQYPQQPSYGSPTYASPPGQGYGAAGGYTASYGHNANRV